MYRAKCIVCDPLKVWQILIPGYSHVEHTTAKQAQLAGVPRDAALRQLLLPEESLRPGPELFPSGYGPEEGWNERGEGAREPRGTHHVMDRWRVLVPGR